MSKLNEFANLTTTSTRGKCQRTLVPFSEFGNAKAAVNADLYSQPEGAKKQERIAHFSRTVSEQTAAEMWSVVTALYDFEDYRENGYSNVIALLQGFQDQMDAAKEDAAKAEAEKSGNAA